MTTDQCNDHSFPEEREPSGRVILAPCLMCGMTAGDGMQALKAALERETFARVTADCASELAASCAATWRRLAEEAAPTIEAWGPSGSTWRTRFDAAKERFHE